MLTSQIKKIGKKIGVAVVMFTLSTPPIMAQIELFTDDVTTTPGWVTSTIRVRSDQQVSSLNVSIGSRLLEGNAASELIIADFATSSLEDSIWEDEVILSLTTPPGLPAVSGKINNVIVGPNNVPANGDVMTITFDATGTQPGDVFELDLNFNGNTSASTGPQNISDSLTFVPALLQIESDMTGGTLIGDVNLDGAIDVDDIDLLTRAVFDGDSQPVFDLNSSGTVDDADRVYWVEVVNNTFFGDANLDGELDSSDLVEVLQAGEYEDGIPENSTWATGDFDGNLEFDTGDLIAAFRTGAYEMGPRTAVANVPEPSSLTATLLALSLSVWGRRHRRTAR